MSSVMETETTLPFPVTVIENSQDSLDKGMKIIEKNYSNTVAKGRMSEDDFKNKMSLIKGATSLESISSADVVVEAVFEEMTLKKEMFENGIVIRECEN